MEAWHDYRRWAFESAALDLGLRQAGRTLVEAVEREPRPVTFVTSRRLADPPSADQIRAWLEPVPEPPLQARPDERLDGRARRRPRGDRRDRLASTSRASTRAPPSTSRRTRCSIGESLDAFPDAWVEDPERHRRDAADPRAARGPHHVGRADPLGRGHREPPVAAADDQHQAVALRRRQAALRRLRLLRRARDRRLRRRPVGARPGPRTDPVPRLALPSGHAERRRSARLQRARAAARIAREPARSGFRSGGLPLGRITV